MTSRIVVGVLALQGAFAEHIVLLRKAAGTCSDPSLNYEFIEVRTPAELARCDALVLPGGESTAISLIAERTGLLEPLRDFVKVQRKPVWGTCAGLILLAESANKSKATGQELIGGLDVRVHRNYFGRQVESFEADLDLVFLPNQPRFRSVFIRAPVVEKILEPAPTSEPTLEALTADLALTATTVLAPPRQSTTAPVEIMCRLPGRARALRDKSITAEDLGEDGDIVAVRQGNVFGMAFHPELTGDERIHAWWLQEVVRLKSTVDV
jgi:5'-phosphate synthase pdxT subunit